jgi:hypothetical protein
MKSLLKLSVLVFSIITVTVSSCKKDEEPNTLDQFFGSWTCRATSNNFGVTNYVITITEDASNNTGIKIYNFDNLGTSIFASSNTNGNNITIPQQSVLGNTVEGSGSLQSTTKLLYTYTIDDGITVDTVSADCTKQ